MHLDRSTRSYHFTTELLWVIWSFAGSYESVGWSQTGLSNCACADSELEECAVKLKVPASTSALTMVIHCKMILSL